MKWVWSEKLFWINWNLRKKKFDEIFTFYYVCCQGFWTLQGSLNILSYVCCWWWDSILLNSVRAFSTSRLFFFEFKTFFNAVLWIIKSFLVENEKWFYVILFNLRWKLRGKVLKLFCCTLEKLSSVKFSQKNIAFKQKTY